MSNKMLSSSDRNERAEGQKMKEILEKRGYCYGETMRKPNCYVKKNPLNLSKEQLEQMGKEFGSCSCSRNNDRRFYEKR
ncbi:hypothetical protein ACT7DE_19190 [Bacillus paranthracis]